MIQEKEVTRSSQSVHGEAQRWRCGAGSNDLDVIVTLSGFTLFSNRYRSVGTRQVYYRDSYGEVRLSYVGLRFVTFQWQFCVIRLGLSVTID